MRRLVMLLVGGFVCISILVAVVPEVTGITTTGITNTTVKAVVDIGKWLIPLAGAVVLVLFGLSRMRRRAR